LNIASALIKQVIETGDLETWSYVKREYLPVEFHRVFDYIDTYYDNHSRLPTFEDLTLSLRHAQTKEKVLAIEAVDVDVDPFTLLQYLKNEYTQKEIFNSLDNYIEETVLFAEAEESVQALHQIVLDIQDKVELEQPTESMQRISLFDSEEDLGKYLPLGFNAEYDHSIKFSPRDLVLVGGKRGAGKSICCANVANSVYEEGRSALYFTIEMDSRSILQRICSISTGVPHNRIKSKNLSILEWEKVAKWWADRFKNGEELLAEYKKHRDFDKFHDKLKLTELAEKQLDVIYDPSLTIAKIKAELDKKVPLLQPGVIVVDYINQVKRSNIPSRNGQYDWTEQVEVSKALKAMAQEYECTVFSPYQTDATGEARFAKGILDAADAAYALEAWDEEDQCISFNCVKMRSNPMKSFTSTMNWESLKIGPETALNPKEKEDSSHKTGEEIDDDIS
jgi:hypothetical protein